MQIANVSYYAPAGASRYAKRQHLGSLSLTERGLNMGYIVIKIMMLNEQIKAFRRDEKGATLIEYGLLATLVAVAAIAGMTLLGTDLNLQFTTLAGRLRG